MAQILIVDTDTAFAQRLSKALSQLEEEHTVVHVKTAIEARLLLASQPQDLAFIPPEDNGEGMNALRSLQPDLRLVITAPTVDFTLPAVYGGRVQGVLIRPLLHFDVEDVVRTALNQPAATSTSFMSRQRPVQADWADSSAVIDALQKVNLGELVKTAVFTRGARLIGYWGDLTDAEAAATAHHIGHTWNGSNYRIQIQFMHLPAQNGDLLLYTRYIIDQFLLTLVSLPDTPLSELRRRAEQLANILRDTLAGETPISQSPDVQPSQRTTYAVVWRPVNTLPTALLIPLRRIIERLATANGCVLTHSEVRPDVIHLVVNCPPEHSSSWLVVLLKSGTEEAIQEEYGVMVNLWEPGYHVEEREEPLAASELRVFLQQKAGSRRAIGNR